MPLYRKKSFPLSEPPERLDPKEHVFQIRFTKEIFRDYEAYLKRLNLYRQRVWRCRVTGKSNLTYEEALVSESRAAENVQNFPEHLVSPVLHMIQFSTLNLTDLVNELYDRLQKEIFEGLQLHGKKDESLCLCKVLKVLDDNNTTRYEVGWLSEDNKVTDTAIVKAEDLIHGKPPARRVLKAFIRESTSQNAPWMIHESLAKKYSISIMFPKELRDKFLVENGRVIKANKDAHKTNTMDVQGLKGNRKRKQIESGNVDDLSREEEKSKEVPIQYPIDDLLLSPNSDDLSKRPSPSSEFGVPMTSVGDLLMVWDFCCSFGKLLRLWPFTLQDFENAINHKESNGILVVEIHSAILQLLIKDEGEYFVTLKRLRRTCKITLTNWVEFLCDFLLMEDKEELSSHVSVIKRGFYGLLDTDAKLHILKELIMDALTTNAIREKLDDCMDQAQALAAEKRMEARKKKDQQPKSENADLLQMSEAHVSNSIVEEVPHDDGVHSSKENHIMENGRKKHDLSNLKRGEKTLNVIVGNGSANGNDKGNKSEKDINSEIHDQMSENRMQHIDREMEKLSIRTSSLGKDRNYNRYWFFQREGRLFIESLDSKQWGYYTTKDELDALIGSLNTKGVRERALRKQLEKHYSRISTALQKRSKEVAQNVLLNDNVRRRSTRVQAQPRESSVMAFLKYVNKWKGN